MNQKTKALVVAAVAGMMSFGMNAYANSNQKQEGSKKTSWKVAKADKKHSKGKKVKCFGVNSCKGHGECGTADHDCAGKNGCKGKGWVYMKSKAACKKKKGKVM